MKRVLFCFLVFIFAACTPKWQTVEDPHSGFEYQAFNQKPLAVSEEKADFQSRSWMIDGGVLTVGIVPHPFIEATDEALQLLINGILKEGFDLEEKKATLVAFKEVRFGNAIGAEMTVQIRNGQPPTYGRLLVVDNRHAQLSISMRHSHLDALQHPDVDHIFNSVLSRPQSSRKEAPVPID